jgi:hypothetical protein
MWIRRLVPLLAVLASACAQAPTDSCRRYVACQAEYDEASRTGPADVAQYEDGGLCWQSAENASICDEQCREGLAALEEAARSANLVLPSCGA